jgi:hypothetical protein
MAASWHLETVLFGKLCIGGIAIRLAKRIKALLVVNIADSLEEEKGENVSLEVGGVYRTAKNVRGIPEPRFD